jgi:hypothetical protein
MSNSRFLAMRLLQTWTGQPSSFTRHFTCRMDFTAQFAPDARYSRARSCAVGPQDPTEAEAGA